MPETPTLEPRKVHLPGLDAAATPVIGVGLGLTGIALGVRPKLAAWPLALTALAALLYRDPRRVTPKEPAALFAPADGSVIEVDDLYEHRFLHTDAVRIAIAAAPYDVPVQRSPVDGTVAYLEHVPGEGRPVWDVRNNDQNERQYIGIKTSWGPVLVIVTTSPLARRLFCHVQMGDVVQAGSRLCTARFGAKVELLLPYAEIEELPQVGARLQAGITRIGRSE